MNLICNVEDKRNVSNLGKHVILNMRKCPSVDGIVPYLAGCNEMNSFRMTDSDTESFHSAVDNLSERSDSDTDDINLRMEKADEKRRVSAARDNECEVDEYEEILKKDSNEKSATILGLSANRKKQISQNLSFSDGPSKCISAPKIQSSDCLSVDGTYFDPTRKTVLNAELDIGGVFSRKERPFLQFNKKSIGKASRSRENDRLNKTCQNNEELFEVGKFTGEGMEKFGKVNDKPKTGSKDSERRHVPWPEDSLDSRTMKKEMQKSEEKTNIDDNGWNDWEIEYSGNDRIISEILEENGEPPLELTSGEESPNLCNSELKVCVLVYYAGLGDT